MKARFPKHAHDDAFHNQTSAPPQPGQKLDMGCAGSKSPEEKRGDILHKEMESAKKNAKRAAGSTPIAQPQASDTVEAAMVVVQVQAPAPAPAAEDTVGDLPGRPSASIADGLSEVVGQLSQRINDIFRAATDVPAEAPAEAPAGAPAEAPAEAPAGAPAGAPATEEETERVYLVHKKPEIHFTLVT